MGHFVKKAKILFLLSLIFFLPCLSFSQERSGQPTAAEALQPLIQEGAVPLMEEAIVGDVSTYTLGKGDVIQIVVRNQPEFSGNFVVGPDGKIQYRFVGDIKVEELTKDEVKDILEQELQRFVKVPEVSVIIAAYRSKFVYLLGQVGRPGKYPMAGDQVSLRDAIFAAGVPPYQAALRRTYVINPDETNPSCRKIDLYALLYKGVLKDNVTLTPGDVVVVPTTVPSEINRALRTILAPFSAAASTAATAEGFME